MSLLGERHQPQQQQDLSVNSQWPMSRAGYPGETDYPVTTTDNGYNQQVQQSTGPSIASDQNSSINSTDHMCRRRYYFSINASLAALNAAPSKGQFKLTNEYGMKYRPNNSQQGGDRKGDPNHAVIFSAKLLWAKNDLNTDVMVGSNIMKGNCYSNVTKQRGFIVIPANNMINYGKGLSIHFPHRDVFGKIMATYADLTEDAIKANGPYKDERTGVPHWMVKTGTPIAEILHINQNNEDSPYNLQNMLMPNDYYWVNEHYYNGARDTLRNDVLKKLPWKPMKNMEINISRAGSENWINAESSDVDIRAKAYQQSLNTPGTISGIIEIAYRLHGHGMMQKQQT